MAIKRPSSTEDEFVAREEAKRRELGEIRRQQAEEAAAREARRGTCPRGCPTKLVEQSFRDILIDRCPTCHGVWLDPGELEKVSRETAAAVRSLVDFFSGKSGG
jgi:hypothetical protein